MAVQSRFFAVGAVVPWLEAGVGAVATQSYANTTYGPRGLKLLKAGKSPSEVVTALTASDEEKPLRQVGIVDHLGRAAQFTGARCHAWAGGRLGKHYAVQGNLLVSQATVDAMAKSFEQASGELAQRLLAALEAGQAAGGDARGRQSAALIVVRKGGGYARLNDRYLDLRVDDHSRPIVELRRLLELALGNDPVSRARTLLRSGQEREAREVLTEALRREQLHPLEQIELARLLYVLGDGQEARTALERVLTSASDAPDLLLQVARTYAFARDPASCRSTLEKLLAVSTAHRDLLTREQDDAIWAPVRHELIQLLAED